VLDNNGLVSPARLEESLVTSCSRQDATQARSASRQGATGSLSMEVHLAGAQASRNDRVLHRVALATKGRR
jgi:hypothetical protein